MNEERRKRMESKFCMKYCPHGGVCMQEPNHDGLHSTKSPLNDEEYCEWTDEECIPKQEADLLLMAMSPLSDELTRLILDMS